MTNDSERYPQRQMRFVSPEGRREVLWVEEQDRGVFRVLNVPVWVYGVSVGTLVRGRDGVDGRLEYAGLVEPSPGGTVRCVAPRGGAAASELYLSRVVPDVEQLGIGIGPATFLDPRLVAIHVHVKDRWWPDLGEYLNRLVDQGVLQQWEVADPDEYAEDGAPQPPARADADDLVHPAPEADRQKFFKL